MNHLERMGHARAIVLQKAPYFSSIVYGFVFQGRDDLDSMAVSAGMVLYYGITWAESAELAELAADIAHETHHFVRNHFIRFDALSPEDKELLNIAGDLAINPDLRNEGWKLAASAIFPADFGFPEGKTTEEYFALLKKRKEDEKKKQKKDEKGGPAPGQGSPQNGPPDAAGGEPAPALATPLGAGRDPGQGSGHPKPDQAPQPPAPSGKSEGQAEGQTPSQDAGPGGPTPRPKGPPKPSPKGISAGRCGSLAGASNAPGIEQKLDAEVGRNEFEKKLIERQVQEDIKAYVEAQGRGSLPDSLVTWATAVVEEPKVDWRDELAQELRDATGQMQAGGEDFSLTRPSKRSFLRGMIRPGLVEYEPVVAFVLDSSGSMRKPQLKEAITQAIHVLEQLGISEMWFCEADAGVAMDFQLVHPDFFQKLEIRGRGGTDFRPAIKAASLLTPRPDILIYGTDGDGAAPATAPPDMHVIWCVVPGHYNKAPTMWGKTIFVTDKKQPEKEPRPPTVNDFVDYTRP